MHVVATAGHVDHGKSSLVRSLTGMDPDRWEEERRRGLTIDLGFAWTTIPDGTSIAFVDVPGHSRFISNMLAGVGPVPAVILAVAADEGWMPQTQEHVDALDALDIHSGILVITRSDLASPEWARRQALERLASTSLAAIPAVHASVVSGQGLPELRQRLQELIVGLPIPSADAPVRLWVDRSFSVRGAGTVVTGTLQAGTVRVGDQLALNGARSVHVKGIHVLGGSVAAASGTARVALNLRGVDRKEVIRGDALTGPGPWSSTSVLDAALSKPLTGRTTQGVMHIGSAAVPVGVRLLGGEAVRLSLSRPVPLVPTDRALLRLTGSTDEIVGLRVLDVLPPRLIGRGAALKRAVLLTSTSDDARWAAELSSRRFIAVSDVERLGLRPMEPPVLPEWYVDPTTWEELPLRARGLVTAWHADRPLDEGMPMGALQRLLDLPAAPLLTDVLSRAELNVSAGRVSDPAHAALTPEVEKSVRTLELRWEVDPLDAPSAPELRDLGLGAAQVAAAGRAGRLTALAEGVVVSPRCVDRATSILEGLVQPFTLSDARQALGSSRRVTVPLLEMMDRRGVTVRVTQDTRRLT